jgi:FkbM family methyltransferase
LKDGLAAISTKNITNLSGNASAGVTIAGTMLTRCRRPLNMFRNLRNPWTYLAVKFGLSRQDPLMLRLRNGVVAEVSLRLLQTFKESVFAEDYIQGFPPEVVGRFGNSNVLDVGANAGYFSLWWLSRFPGSRVVSVEPMPNNFAQLQRNAALNPAQQMHPVNCAMSSKPGEITLSFDRSDRFTTAASVLENSTGVDKVSVPAVPLARLMENFKFERVDFLKLDCEGSEYDILYDTDPAVLEKVDCIAMETHRGSRPEQTKDAVCDFLRAAKFQVHTRPGSQMVYAWR